MKESLHWFGLEMLDAYKSAKLKVKNKDSPIEITLNESTHKIERDSLQNVTTAIELATYPGRRGFMSLPELHNTEQA